MLALTNHLRKSNLCNHSGTQTLVLNRSTLSGCQQHNNYLYNIIPSYNSVSGGSSCFPYSTHPPTGNSSCSGSSIKLDVLRNDGTINFILPLPNKEKCFFPLYTNETVSDLIIDIRVEDRENSQVEIKDVDGIIISPSTQIADLIKTPFVICIDNIEKYTVDTKTPHNNLFSNVVGNIHVSDLISKALFQKVQERMFIPNRHHTTYKEYIRLCRSYGIQEDKAKSYLHSLHLAGVVLHFSQNIHLKDYIFLKPEAVTGTLAKTLGVRFQNRTIPELISELESLLPTYLPIHSRKLELDSIAHHRAQLFMYFGLGYLLLQSGFLAHMVWITYDWGVMEPVTYFVFLSTLIGGLYFFLISNEEFTYNALENRRFKIVLKRLYLNKKKPFNWKNWNQLNEKVTTLKAIIGDKLPEALKSKI